MGILDRFRDKGEKVYKLKGYTAENKWIQIEEFDSEVAFDEAVDEIEDPAMYKRFKLMEYRGNKYVRTVWKEVNPDFELPPQTGPSLEAGEFKKFVRSEIEKGIAEMGELYSARMEAGMKILTKAYESSIDILTEAMKTSAKVEVEGVKQKLDQAKELIKLATPTPPAGSTSGEKKEGGFIEELGGAITEGVKAAVKEGVKERAKEKGVSVPEK